MFPSIFRRSSRIRLGIDVIIRMLLVGQLNVNESEFTTRVHDRELSTSFSSNFGTYTAAGGVFDSCPMSCSADMQTQIIQCRRRYIFSPTGYFAIANVLIRLLLSDNVVMIRSLNTHSLFLGTSACTIWPPHVEIIRIDTDNTQTFLTALHCMYKSCVNRLMSTIQSFSSSRKLGDGSVMPKPRTTRRSLDMRGDVPCHFIGEEGVTDFSKE